MALIAPMNPRAVKRALRAAKGESSAAVRLGERSSGKLPPLVTVAYAYVHMATAISRRRTGMSIEVQKTTLSRRPLFELVIAAAYSRKEGHAMPSGKLANNQRVDAREAALGRRLGRGTPRTACVEAAVAAGAQRCGVADGAG